MAADGYEIYAVSSRDAALEALSRGFEIVLMDVEMPGMSASAFLSQLRKKFPDVPVVVMSGFRAPEFLETFDLRYFLAKPFTAADLLETLAHAEEAASHV